MGQKLDILTANHLKTKRNYIERMTNDSYCMNIAKNTSSTTDGEENLAAAVKVHSWLVEKICRKFN